MLAVYCDGGSMFPASTGVPQEFSLNQALFIIYVNVLPAAIKTILFHLASMLMI